MPRYIKACGFVMVKGSAHEIYMSCQFLLSFIKESEMVIKIVRF